eukprot:sb/3477297/
MVTIIVTMVTIVVTMVVTIVTIIVVNQLLIQVLQNAINTGTDPNLILPNMFGEGSPPDNNTMGGGGMVRGGKRKMFKGGAGDQCVRNNNGTPYKKIKHSGGENTMFILN